MSLSFKDVPPTESNDFPGFCPEYKSDRDIIRNNWQQNDWISFKGYCYLFMMEQMRWPEASVRCMKHGKDWWNKLLYIRLSTQLCLALTRRSFCFFASFRYEGASLASIEDPSEQDFIQSIAKIYQDSHNSFWIGLYKTHNGTVTSSDLWSSDIKLS